MHSFVPFHFINCSSLSLWRFTFLVLNSFPFFSFHRRQSLSSWWEYYKYPQALPIVWITRQAIVLLVLTWVNDNGIARYSEFHTCQLHNLVTSGEGRRCSATFCCCWCASFSHLLYYNVAEVRTSTYTYYTSPDDPATETLGELRFNEYLIEHTAAVVMWYAYLSISLTQIICV